MNRIVIGLTTSPKRVHTILPTLESLFTQTKKADRIVLSISQELARTGETYIIPDSIKDLHEQDKIYLHVTRDYGPATKFIGACELEKDPNTLILWCDDDIIYSSYMVEELSREISDDIAIGGRAGYLTDNTCIPEYSHKRQVHILEGYGGVMCFRKHIPEPEIWPSYSHKEFNELDNYAKISFISDDLIISRALLSKKISLCSCNTDKYNFNNAIEVRDIGLKEDALHKQPLIKNTYAGYTYILSNQHALDLKRNTNIIST